MKRTSDFERIISVKTLPTEGWGKTKRGVSKRLHYFSEERSLCSGSAPGGECLLATGTPIDGEMCPDCVARLRARINRAMGSNRPRQYGARL